MIRSFAIGSGRALFTLPGGRFYNATKPLEGRILDMTTELKPCPFCGGEVHLTNSGPGRHFVHCMDCTSLFEHGTPEEAVDTWNRRAFEANQARIAELESRLRDAIRIADEAAEEWDKAPSGMRAGKILLALAGHVPGYRADTDAVHAALSPQP